MASTIDYFEIEILCSECGTRNTVLAISEYDTDNHTYTETDIVAGQKCIECERELNSEDIP